MSDFLEESRRRKAARAAAAEKSLSSDLAQTTVAHSGVGFGEKPAPPKGQAELSSGHTPGYFPTPDYEKLPSDVKALSYPAAFLGGLSAGSADEVAGGIDALAQGKNYSEAKPAWERFYNASRQYHPTLTMAGAMAPSLIPESKVPAFLARLPGFVKAAGYGAIQGAGDAPMGGDTLGEAALGAGGSLLGYGALRGVGGLSREGLKRFDQARLGITEAAIEAKQPQEKILMGGTTPAGEDKRRAALNYAINATDPSDPNKKLIPWFGSTQGNLERIRGDAKRPSLQQVLGQRKGALVDELEAGRKITPGATFEGMPERISREMKSASGDVGLMPKRYVLALEANKGTFFDEQATTALEQKKAKEMMAAASGLEKAKAAADVETRKMESARRAEFETWKQRTKKAQADRDAEFKSALQAWKSEKRGVESAAEAERAAKVAAIQAENKAFLDSLRGVYGKSGKQSPYSEPKLGPSMEATAKKMMADRLASVPPVEVKFDKPMPLPGAPPPAIPPPAPLPEDAFSAIRASVSDAAAKLRAAQQIKTDPVLKTGGSLPGGAYNLKEIGFAKEPFSRAMRELESKEARAYENPEHMAAAFTRRGIKDAENQQAMSLAVESGDPSKYQEFLDAKREAGIGSQLTRVADSALKRVRGNMPLGVPEVITGASALSGMLGGGHGFGESAAVALPVAAAVGAARRYGPNFAANLMNSAQNSKTLTFGYPLPDVVAGVGVRASQLAPQMSSVMEPLRKYFETKKLDEEEAKSNYVKNGG